MTFAGHTPHDSTAACEPCRVGGDAGDIDLELGGVREWAERIGRKYERGNAPWRRRLIRLREAISARVKAS